MGSKRTYKCSKCSYSVLTSAGKDYGMLAVVDTYLCGACNQIVDVCVGQQGEVYSESDVSNNKIENKFGVKFYTCPECGSKTKLVKWCTKTRPCPKCDGKLDVDPEGMHILWD